MLARAFAPEATVTPLSVPDEAWAERSQAALQPVRVGRVVLSPPWALGALASTPGDDTVGPDLVITIVPSMGFGTGHHASTRLCLALLQECDVGGRSALDAGTGSGALALAAWRLGAGDIVAVDSDPDAIQSATENILLNGAERFVRLYGLDLADAPTLSQRFDSVTANLTGGLLQRFAPLLSSRLAAHGALIVSGLLEDEETEVLSALVATGLRCDGRSVSEGWVGLRMRPA
jgi:ribosomal protein L11 methyltransferase